MDVNCAKLVEFVNIAKAIVFLIWPMLAIIVQLRIVYSVNLINFVSNV
jgi:hypothetical protein